MLRLGYPVPEVQVDGVYISSRRGGPSFIIAIPSYRPVSRQYVMNLEYLLSPTVKNNEIPDRHSFRSLRDIEDIVPPVPIGSKSIGNRDRNEQVDNYFSIGRAAIRSRNIQGVGSGPERTCQGICDAGVRKAGDRAPLVFADIPA